MKHLIATKSYAISIRIVKLCEELLIQKRERFLVMKLLQNGTAIGAIIKSIEYYESKTDFVSKMRTALNAASETEYWLLLLKDTEYITENEFDLLQKDFYEISKLLYSVVEMHNSDSKISN